MRNLTLVRIWDIPIRINISLIVFLPVLAWLIGSGEQIPLYAGVIGDVTGTPLDGAALAAGNLPWLIGALAAVGLFVSVTVHELGHAWMALRYDLEIESITLWIFGGIASLAEMPKEWERELRIAVAGPIASVGVAAVCFVVASSLPASLPVTVFLFGWLALVNVTLTVFNMLPAFPMDGGRVLRALLARNRPYASATRTAARVGMFFAFLFGFVGVLNFNIILVLIAFFIYGAARSESRVTMLEDLLQGFTVRDVMERDGEPIAAETRLEDLGRRMLLEHRSTYLVVDDEGGDVIGFVDVGQIGDLSEDAIDEATVGDVAVQDVLRVGIDDQAFDALIALSQRQEGVAIVEEGGEAVGVVSRADFGRLLDIRRSVRIAQ